MTQNGLLAKQLKNCHLSKLYKTNKDHPDHMQHLMLDIQEYQQYNVHKPKNMYYVLLIKGRYPKLIITIFLNITSLKKWQYSAAKYNIMLSFNPSRHNISANLDNSATFFISEKLHSPL